MVGEAAWAHAPSGACVTRGDRRPCHASAHRAGADSGVVPRTPSTRSWPLASGAVQVRCLHAGVAARKRPRRADKALPHGSRPVPRMSVSRGPAATDSALWVCAQAAWRLVHIPTGPTTTKTIALDPSVAYAPFGWPPASFPEPEKENPHSRERPRSNVARFAVKSHRIPRSNA